MTRNVRLALVIVILVVSRAGAASQPPPRALSEAMRNIFAQRDYTAFDWISGHYLKGTLTLQGWARTSQLKQQSEKIARATAGVDDVINEIEIGA